MAVKEVGVIVNGIPIYQQQFRKTSKTRNEVQKHLLRSAIALFHPNFPE